MTNFETGQSMRRLRLSVFSNNSDIVKINISAKKLCDEKKGIASNENKLSCADKSKDEKDINKTTKSIHKN